MADDDIYSLQGLARNQMTHYGPDPVAEEVGRRVRATGQNFYNSWFGPLERLGRAAMTGTLDTSDPQAIHDAANAAAWATGGRMPFARTGTLGAGGGKITAYHGSPYDFDAFDISKIGTGEGAQAYGHGLYFAENPAVAEDYKRALAAKANMSGADRIDAEAQKWISQQGGIEQAKAAIDEEMKRWADNKRTVEYLQLVKDAMKPPNPGHMYQVDINADPEHFLDWDRPLSEQSEHVRNALQSIPNMTTGGPNPKGSQIHDLADLAHRDKSASEILREAGIPGIRYLDQFSRNSERRRISDLISQLESGLQRETGAERARTQAIIEEEKAKLAALPTEKDTSNYVVFNDQLIDIIKKYGIAGLIAAGAYSHQDSRQ